MERPAEPIEKRAETQEPLKEKPLKATLPLETIEIIHKMWKEGKSPKIIKSKTGVGVIQIRQHTSGIDYGSAQERTENQEKLESNDSQIQTDERLPGKATLPGLKVKERETALIRSRQIVSPAQRKGMPRRFLHEARRLLNQFDKKTAVPSMGYPWPKSTQPKQKAGRPQLTERDWADGRYVPPAKREILEYKKIMKEHELPTLKKVYFDLMDRKSPEAVADETKIPVKRIVQIIFNRITQKAIFAEFNDEIQKKYAMKNELPGYPDEPDIIAQNKALLFVIAARKNIHETPKYWEKNEWRRPLV
ncbi:MAG: hypothetical protein WC408_06370 [Candidatus Micrarchaeia archaeon]